MAINYWLGGWDNAGLSPADMTKWSVAQNWSLGHVPTVGENVIASDSTHSIDPIDVSSVLLGYVRIAAGMTAPKIGDYNGGSPQYLKIACQQDKFIEVVTETSAQQIWLEVGGTNSVDLYLRKFGTVDSSAYGSQGVHIKSSGTGSVSVKNTGVPFTFESGTAGQIEVGAGNTIVQSGANVLNYRSYGLTAISTLYAMPTTSLNVSEGEITAESATAIQSLTQLGGNVYWNGGADITNFAIYRGLFDASRAKNQFTITDGLIYGSDNPAETTVNLANGVGGAVITNTLAQYGNPTILLPDGTTLGPAMAA